MSEEMSINLLLIGFFSILFGILGWTVYLEKK